MAGVLRATEWPRTCCAWLVRHGQSEGNRHGTVQGQATGIGLSAAGRLQASAAAAGLPCGGHGRPVAIVSSDLRRCRDTAAVLGTRAGLAVRLDSDLRERSFGGLEGRPWRCVSGRDVGVIDARISDPSTRPAGGESLQDLAERVVRALRRAVDPDGGPVVVVTHGGPIRVATGLGAVFDSGRIPDLTGLAWLDVPHATPLPVCLRLHA